MSRTLRPLAALAMVALISAGCGSNAPSETGTASSSGSANTARREGNEVRRVHARPRRQRVPGPGRVERVDHRCGSQRLVAGHEHRGVQEGHQRVQGPAATGVRGPQAKRLEAGGALKFAQCMRDNGVKDFPDPTPNASPSSTRLESHPPRQGCRAFRVHAASRSAAPVLTRAGIERMRKNLGPGRPCHGRADRRCANGCRDGNTGTGGRSSPLGTRR